MATVTMPHNLQDNEFSRLAAECMYSIDHFHRGRRQTLEELYSHDEIPLTSSYPPS